MKTHDSFYQEIDKHGGVLDVSTLPASHQGLAKMCLDACLQIRDSINSSDLVWPLGNVQIELVNNDTFNAFAHRDNDGNEGIAVYAGLLNRLFKYSFDLWSDKGVLGSPPVGERASEIIEKLIERDQLMRWQVFSEEPLTEEEKNVRAINTAMTGFIFIVMHEVGHLVKAHIPHISKTSSVSIQTLYERDNNEDSIEFYEELQALEFDADGHAAQAIIDFAMTTWNMGKIFPINFPFKKRDDLFSYLVNIYRGVLLAIFSMDAYNTDPKLESQSSHPTPGIRLGIVLAASGVPLDHPFKVPKKFQIAAYTAASMEIGDLLTKKNISAATLEHDLRALLSLAKDKAATLCKLDLQPEIDRRIQFLGRDPKHFDQFEGFYKK